MEASTADWGDFDRAIHDRVRRCEDELAMLKRILSGDVPRRRLDFHAKAVRLVDNAHELYRFAQDAERTLNECGEPTPQVLGGTTTSGRCGLSPDHEGGHQPYPPASPLARHTEQARALAKLAEDASNRLGWLALSLDFGENPIVGQGERGRLAAQLKQQLGAVSREAAFLTKVMADMRRDLDTPEPGPRSLAGTQPLGL